MACIEENQELLEHYNAEFARRVLPVTAFVGTEIVIGFLGNLLILYIFIFRYHSCNFRTFVICLSCIDIMCTFTTMPGEIVTQSFWFKYPVPKVCKFKDFCNVFTVFAETLCLLVIAVDRYRKVCRPLQWQIEPRMAIALCITLVVIATAAAAPVTEYWGTICKLVPFGNITLNTTQCEMDEDYRDQNDPLVYEAVVGSFVLLFLVTMFVLYVQVSKVLIRERRLSEAQVQPTNAIRIRKKTKIMIVLTGCFMVTTILYYIMICILGSPEGIFDSLSKDGKVAFLFFLRFYFIQHIINPILYCLMDPTVKDALREMKHSLIDSLSRKNNTNNH
ncbi:hypothetical protein ACF0H5_016110 [Mactra antiquata]